MSHGTIDELITKAYDVMAKVLTTKDRKKLKDSSYCYVTDKRRAFPVPDCQHVATAKTYLARSKFSEATKKKIAACINRKAKALKCNVTKKAKAYTLYTYASLTEEEKKLYNSDVFKSTKEIVEASIKNPGLDIY